ncbi:MAG: enoyl-CoA hydratase/isomerase family protein [Rhodospirillaceae bacterium]|jgi:enoyl-CoA hydratase|nr:enoyl-CoA hydratase/isomerase family protein [Rhodospirillaceae bacterium]MBT6138337.1 enoyl-CoA hydratase/isomerase family protein [Rhodospirillaceae bacterium]
MDAELIKLEVDDYVGIVTINNPPVNAHSQQVLEEITRTFDTISDRDEIRVAVLTGAGKVFCAGADIKARVGSTRGPGDHWANSRKSREAYHSIMECQKPVIAAINGPALGGGLAFAASCDILVASETGCLGLPEIGVGLLGGGRHAQRLFGHSRLRRMMLTGHRVFGPELYRLGVVEACVPPEDLMNTATDLAREIAAKSPIATRLAKHALNQIEELSLRDGYRFEQTMTGQLSETEDSKEAMRAFVEKREPEFKGR